MMFISLMSISFFLSLMGLVIGGSYNFHRFGIIFTIVFMFLTLIIKKDKKIYTIISIVSGTLGISISLLNWLFTAIPEPSSFFRFLFLKEYTQGWSDITLSQLASIINIVISSGIIIGFLVNKKKRRIISIVITIIGFLLILFSLWVMGLAIKGYINTNLLVSIILVIIFLIGLSLMIIGLKKIRQAIPKI